jgi:crotonobetainyl-CoA:carnitine CoA-transferase CaiB-like acyl-CoA transferase
MDQSTDDRPKPLAGVRVISLAVNLPGPLACARLHALGAEVVKVEPPAGDPLAAFTRAWYDALARGQQVVAVDLKTGQGRAALDAMLAGADLLVTATRPAALGRLGLGWAELHARHPRLCHLAIVGHAPPDEERAGHDLTYAAGAGLAAPPHLPPSLFVDLASAERAVSDALALLMARGRDGAGRFASVALGSIAEELAAPLRYGLTTADGILGGGAAVYGLYAAKEGWVALAALEPAFARRLAEALGVDATDRPALEAAFLARTAAEWEAWARERDLPIAAVRTVSGAR